MTEPLPPSVGPEFGLEPQRPELHERIVVPYTSRDLVSTEDYRTGTEFGGVDGLIQPPPHTPTAAERRRMIMALDPTDPGDGGPGSLAAPELEGDFT
jgi:hypothetical protein